MKAMFEGAQTVVRTTEGDSNAFNVKVGLHQGSVLSPLLFVIVMEMISREVRAGLPLELLYADDLILMAESEESLCDKIVKWKSGLEAKGLKMIVVCECNESLHSQTSINQLNRQHNNNNNNSNNQDNISSAVILWSLSSFGECRTAPLLMMKRIHCSVVQTDAVSHSGCRGDAMQGAGYHRHRSLLCLRRFHRSTSK